MSISAIQQMQPEELPVLHSRLKGHSAGGSVTLQPTCTEMKVQLLCCSLSKKETQFIQRLNSSEQPIPSPYLPARHTHSLKTLVLDLDETLLHSSLRPDFPYEKELQVTLEGRTGVLYTGRRPGLQTFLEVLASMYELVAFTASTEEYANAVLDWIDPGKLIKHRLYRSHCVLVEGILVKDLRVLGRDLSDVVILENSFYSFGLQLDNGVPVRSWYGAAADSELQRVLPELQHLAQSKDVRKELAPRLCLRQLILGS